MADFAREIDDFLYEIEQFCIDNGASDFVHYFLRSNYDIIGKGQITLILVPIDAALQRLVNKTGKSLEEISNLPEGIDVLNNFLCSTPFNSNGTALNYEYPVGYKYPIYTAINGTTYGRTANDITALKEIKNRTFLKIFGGGRRSETTMVWIIDGIIRRNAAQIEALTRANPPQYPISRNGIIGNNPVTNLDDLPNPILRKIVLNFSDLSETIDICRINTRFNSSICDSEDFWNEKLRRDHPTNRSMLGKTWKETYQRLTGKLYMFGSGYYGQLGLGEGPDKYEPSLVQSLINISVVACGGQHTAAISNGQLYTFGNGGSGQLGRGDEDFDEGFDEDADERHPLPRLVEGLKNVTAVACGAYHTAIILNGRLYTFGDGHFGNLGHGDSVNRLRPTMVEGLDNVIFVACGAAHTAAISNGRLYTFGNGEFGRLGHGDEQGQDRPKLVKGLDNVTFVACGFYHTAAISDGRLYTFGSGHDGQLGHGDIQNQLRPVLVEDLDDVTAVSCGTNHTAVISNGRLYTFGTGEAGQLGHGRTQRELRPRLVEGLNNVNVVACGHSYTAVVANRQLYTFGLNANGQLGQSENAEDDFIFVPKLVRHLHNVISVATGSAHTAVIASPNNKI